METVHQQTIAYLSKLLASKRIAGVTLRKDFSVTYFKSGGGTHLYLITGGKKKYVARVNFYSLKNDWGIKKQEFQILKKIEHLSIAPKVYYLSTKNPLGQHFTIVDYVEGEPVRRFADTHIISVAKTLKKLHAITFRRSGDTFPPKDALPYTCDIFDLYANGADKQIEKYTDLPGIELVVEPFNRVRKSLGLYFSGLHCFDGITSFSLVHADLKKENMLVAGDKIRLIDWEGGGSDIPEVDIGNFFADSRLTKMQQQLFLKTYYGRAVDAQHLERIYAVKIVLDFFRIMDDYMLNKRKAWDANRMRNEILRFEKTLPRT
ncbi:MAG: phosphotransferase [Patescibacteria group bacterium]